MLLQSVVILAVSVCLCFCRLSVTLLACDKTTKHVVSLFWPNLANRDQVNSNRHIHHRWSRKIYWLNCLTSVCYISRTTEDGVMWFFVAEINSIYLDPHKRFISYVLLPIHLSSICRLSIVCNVRAPYSGGSNFQQFFYGIRYLAHPLTSTENFTEIVPGEPLRRGS